MKAVRCITAALVSAVRRALPTESVTLDGVSRERVRAPFQDTPLTVAWWRVFPGWGDVRIWV